MKATNFTPKTAHPEQKPIAAWANGDTDELVVHPFLTWEGEDDSRWVISHRRTGLKITGWCYFTTREKALEFAIWAESLGRWDYDTQAAFPVDHYKHLEKAISTKLGEIYE